MFSTWQSKLKQAKNHLGMAVKDLIISVVAEARRINCRLKEKDDAILDAFRETTVTQLNDYEKRIDEILAKRPKPGRVAALENAVQTLAVLKPNKTVRQTIPAVPSPRNPLFPT